MLKQLCGAVLALFLLCGSVQAQTPEELRETVSYLASDELRGRASGSAGIKEAQEYIVEELKAVGIETHYQPVPKANCRNVVAWIKGASDDYIVVGAHLDHMGVQRDKVINGADDNASGSAAILALAKRVAKIRKLAPFKPLRSVVFVWFTAEERGLVGARHYVSSPLSPHGDKLPIFMLNLDMVGHLGSKIPRLAANGAFIPDEVLNSLAEKYPFAPRITLRNRQAASDQIPFYNKGVPCVMLHTGMHSRYHRPSDDTETLDFPGMAEVCHYAYDLMMAIAGVVPDYKIYGERTNAE